MIDLILASLFFPLSHFLISSTPLRAMLVNLLGERRYSLSYSLLAVAALFWLIFAYRHAPARPLWDAPQWLSLALIPVIVVSSILAVAGLTTPNPVIVRSEALFDRPDIVRGILRVTRNAFFWGAGLFSIALMITLGHVAGLLTFGSIGFVGIAGASILDAKKARQHGRASFWRSFRVANGLSCARLDYGELRLACVCLSARLFCTVLRFERESFSRSRSHIATANGRTRASRLFASLGGLTSRHSSFRLPTKSSCCTLAPPKSRFFKLSQRSTS